jgi:hypothetical protein
MSRLQFSHLCVQDRCFNVTCGGVDGFIGSVPDPVTINNGTLWTDCMCIGYDLSDTGADGFGPDSGIGRCAGDVCYEGIL